MKAVTYCKDSDVFVFADITQPKLDNKFDVLVKVKAVGLNPVDSKVNDWHAMIEDQQATFVGGLDVSGEIVALGDSVANWKVGDKVLYHGNMRRVHGGFAEYALHDSRSLIKHPQVSPEIAAATPCAAWTAYHALVTKLNIAQRNSLVITAGAGGVGSFALQLARHFNVAHIIATARKTNHRYLHHLGATEAIDYQQENVRERVLAITQGEGVEVALDCAGGNNDSLCASLLAYEGELVELVKTVAPTQYHDAFLRGLSFHQLSLGSGHVHGEKGRATITDAGNAVSALLEQGELSVPALKVIRLAQVPEALIEMRNGRTVGKIVAKVS